ncbi:unnamed protein product [Amoebophrya sp. A120]|nr:unnamed protein product [Amoebophrya sp. A120]|eukprot:GSA120T00008383001.1
MMRLKHQSFFLLALSRVFASAAFLPPKSIFPGDTVQILVPTDQNGSTSFVQLLARGPTASGAGVLSGGDVVVLANSTAVSGGASSEGGTTSGNSLVDLQVPSLSTLLPFMPSSSSPSAGTTTLAQHSFRFRHVTKMPETSSASNVAAEVVQLEVPVSVANREVIFLEADKAIYKPGGVVKFRAVAMDRVTSKPLDLMSSSWSGETGTWQAEIQLRKVVSESEELLIAKLRSTGGPISSSSTTQNSTAVESSSTGTISTSLYYGVFDNEDHLQFPLPANIGGASAGGNKDTYSAKAKLLWVPNASSATNNATREVATSNQLTWNVEEYVLPTFSVDLKLGDDGTSYSKIISQHSSPTAIQGFVTASYNYGGDVKCKDDRISVEVVRKCPVWSYGWSSGPFMPEIMFRRRAAASEVLKPENYAEEDGEDGQDLESVVISQNTHKEPRRKLSSPPPYSICTDSVLTIIEVDASGPTNAAPATSSNAGAPSARFAFTVDLDAATTTSPTQTLRDLLKQEHDNGNLDAIRVTANCTDIASGEMRSSEGIEIKYASTAVRVTSDKEFQPGLPFHVLVEDLTAFVKTSSSSPDVELHVEFSHQRYSARPKYVEVDLGPFLEDGSSTSVGITTSSSSNMKLKTLKSKLFTVPIPVETDRTCCDLGAYSAATGPLNAWSSDHVKISCCVQTVRAFVRVDGVQITTAGGSSSTGGATTRSDSHTACANRKYSPTGHYATAGKLLMSAVEVNNATEPVDSYVVHFRTTLPHVTSVNVMLLSNEDEQEGALASGKNYILYPVNLSPARLFASAQNVSCCNITLRQVTDSVIVHQRPQASYPHYYGVTATSASAVTTTTTTTTRAVGTVESVAYYVGSVNITDLVLDASSTSGANLFSRPGSKFNAVVTLISATPTSKNTTTALSAKAADSVRFEVAEGSASLFAGNKTSFGSVSASWLADAVEGTSSTELVPLNGSSVLPGVNAHLAVAVSSDVGTTATSSTFSNDTATKLFFSAQDRAVSLLTADSNLLSGKIVVSHTKSAGETTAATSTTTAGTSTSSAASVMCREFYDEARVLEQLGIGSLQLDSFSGSALPLTSCEPILPRGYCAGDGGMGITVEVAVATPAGAPSSADSTRSGDSASTTSSSASGAPSVAAQSKLRTFFPETWLWENMNYVNASLLRTTVPDSLTTWDLQGYAIHPGIGLGTDVVLPSLIVAKPVVADVRMPYSITRGELVALRGSVAAHLKGEYSVPDSNLLECTWQIAVSRGLEFQDLLNEYDSVGEIALGPAAATSGGTGKEALNSYELKKARIISKTGATAFPIPVSTAAGRTSILKPSKVRLEVYCAVVLSAGASTSASSYSSVVSRVAYVDRIERSLLVKPEGVKKLKRTNLLITTPTDGSVKSQTVGLSWSSDGEDEQGGALSAGAGVVVPDSKRLTVAITGELLSQTIANIERLVRVPYGCGEQNLMSLAPNVYVFRYLASKAYIVNRGVQGKALKQRLFSNMRTGYVRQLNYKSKSDGGFSAYGETGRRGNFEGSSLWLTAFSLRVFADVGRAGYVGRLMEGGEAQQAVSIDWPNLVPAINFILSAQDASSHYFVSRGRVFSRTMMGSTEESRLSLTSFVLLTLCSIWRELDREYFGGVYSYGASVVTTGASSEGSSSLSAATGPTTLIETTMRDLVLAIRKASAWVKAEWSSRTLSAEASRSVAAEVIAVYALLRAAETALRDQPAHTKIERSLAKSSVLLLTKRDSEGLTYWEEPAESGSSSSANAVASANAMYFRNKPNEPSAASIELTAYAVLILVAAGDLNNAYSGVKWLLKHRSSAGGFRSTQDTVVALEAIAEFQLLEMAVSGSTSDGGGSMVFDVTHNITAAGTSSSTSTAASASTSSALFHYDMTDPELYHTIEIYNETLVDESLEQPQQQPAHNSSESVVVAASQSAAVSERTAVVSVLQEFNVRDSNKNSPTNNSSLLDDCLDFVAKWFNEDKSEIEIAATANNQASTTSASSTSSSQTSPKSYLLALRVAPKDPATSNPNCAAAYHSNAGEMTMLSIGLFTGTVVDAAERERLASSVSLVSSPPGAATTATGTQIDRVEVDTDEGFLHLYLDSLPSGGSSSSTATGSTGSGAFTLSLKAREEFVVQNRQEKEVKLFMYYRPEQNKEIAVDFTAGSGGSAGLSFDEILSGGGGGETSGAELQSSWRGWSGLLAIAVLAAASALA